MVHTIIQFSEEIEKNLAFIRNKLLEILMEYIMGEKERDQACKNRRI